MSEKIFTLINSSNAMYFRSTKGSLQKKKREKKPCIFGALFEKKCVFPFKRQTLVKIF